MEEQNSRSPFFLSPFFIPNSLLRHRKTWAVSPLRPPIPSYPIPKKLHRVFHPEKCNIFEERPCRCVGRIFSHARTSEKKSPKKSGVSLFARSKRFSSKLLTLYLVDLMLRSSVFLLCQSQLGFDDLETSSHDSRN